MANRERKNELKIYLSDDEHYILEQKVKITVVSFPSQIYKNQTAKIPFIMKHSTP